MKLTYQQQKTEAYSDYTKRMDQLRADFLDENEGRFANLYWQNGSTACMSSVIILSSRVYKLSEYISNIGPHKLELDDRIDLISEDITDVTNIRAQEDLEETIKTLAPLAGMAGTINQFKYDNQPS